MLGSLAFNIVHLDPRGAFAFKGEDGGALLVMVLVTTVVSALAQAGRQAREQSERRRLEADLLTELARLFLGDTSGPRADPDQVMVRGLTQILEVPVALAGEQPTAEGQMGLPLRGPGRRSPDRRAGGAGLDTAARGPPPAQDGARAGGAAGRGAAGVPGRSPSGSHTNRCAGRPP